MRTTYCDNCETTVRFYTDFGPGLTWLRICTECDGDLNYNYKVCIIAAGTGTRSRSVSGLHKALLPCWYLLNYIEMYSSFKGILWII